MDPPRGDNPAQSDRDGDWEIYLVNVDGSHLVNLTNDPSSQDMWPSVRE